VGAAAVRVETAPGVGWPGRGQVANSTFDANVATGGAGGRGGCCGGTPGAGGVGLGGGIQAVGAITLVNATIAENKARGGRTGSGGGIDLGGGCATFTNSILSGDSAATGRTATAR
jgi:hypothetical protein